MADEPKVRRASPLREAFSRFAMGTSRGTGSPLTFVLALLVIVVWAVTGPLFGFSDTWQLVINTGTTIVTFLMVFVIQHSQNRDTKAIHLKLDALIEGVKGASNQLIDAEDLTVAELEELEAYFRDLAKKVRGGGQDGGRGAESAPEALRRLRAGTRRARET
ncbi:MAG TPA: low affinity iron permease family protein [Candidatus Thermoplasmatota archaeon]|nr:low affinity iron permease family protein [Candidatus Thermoplasmatota archaeon]